MRLFFFDILQLSQPTHFFIPTLQSSGTNIGVVVLHCLAISCLLYPFNFARGSAKSAFFWQFSIHFWRGDGFATHTLFICTSLSQILTSRGITCPFPRILSRHSCTKFKQFVQYPSNTKLAAWSKTVKNEVLGRTGRWVAYNSIKTVFTNM